MVTKVEVVRIDYPRQWFVAGTVLWAVATSAMFYFASSTREEFVRSVWTTAGSAVGILLGLFMVPPLFTSHLAGEKSLRLSMGLLIDTTIQYSWVKQVKEISVRWGGVRVGIGVKYSPLTRTLYATTEFDDLVSLRLDGPHMIGRLWKRPVEEIVLSASFRPGLVELVKRRAGLKSEE